MLLITRLSSQNTIHNRTTGKYKLVFLILSKRKYTTFREIAASPFYDSFEITEQAWVDYLNLLFLIPPDKAQEAMMLKSMQSSKKLFLYFTDLSEKYLYEPNSPVRNEELYIPVLEMMLWTTVLDDTEKISPQLR